MQWLPFLLHLVTRVARNAIHFSLAAPYCFVKVCHYSSADRANFRGPSTRFITHFSIWEKKSAPFVSDLASLGAFLSEIPRNLRRPKSRSTLNGGLCPADNLIGVKKEPLLPDFVNYFYVSPAFPPHRWFITGNHTFPGGFRLIVKRKPEHVFF